MRFALRNSGQICEVVATHTDTSGGSSETEANELAAILTGASSTNAARAVTPIGEAPSTLRSVAGSTASVGGEQAQAAPAGRSAAARRAREELIQDSNASGSSYEPSSR
jgi:hypothetical protein